MNIVNRILLVFLALFCALYALVVVGCYAIIAPIVWLVWWLVTKKNFKIENILTHLLMPLIIVFDYLENYDEDKELKNVEKKLQK